MELVKLLNDAYDPLLQDSAVEAVGKFAARGRKAEAALLKLLGTEGKGEALYVDTVIKTIGEVGTKKSVPTLKKYLGDSDLRVRRAAAKAFANIQGESFAGLEYLLSQLFSKDYYLVAGATRGLGELSLRAEFVRPMLEGLLAAHPYWAVRRNAAYALGKYGAKGSSAELLEALTRKQEDPRVLEAIYMALERTR